MDNQSMVMACAINKNENDLQGTEFKEFEVIVVYSGISKTLIGTDFNNRFDESRIASWLSLELAGNSSPTLEDSKLRDVPGEIYNQYKDQLHERFRKRAAHYYTEQERVNKGAEKQTNGNIEGFGRLMYESANSSFYQ